MYTLLCDPHRGEKYPFFKSILFSSFVFFSPAFCFFVFFFREGKGPLPPLPPLHLPFSLFLSFGWTDERGKGKHLNTLAQWWTQAKRADVHWEPNTEPPNNNTPSLIFSFSFSFSFSHTHTHSVSYSANTHSPARRIQRPIKTAFKIKAQKIINDPRKQIEAPDHDIKNKTMRPYTIIISAWEQRGEAGDTGCVTVQCHNM